MNQIIQKLQKAANSGKICGITDENGDKYNGKVDALGGSTVVIFDRNRNRRVILLHREIESVRCG